MSNTGELASITGAIKPKWTPFEEQCAKPIAFGLKLSVRSPKRPSSEFQQPDKSIPDWKKSKQLRLAYNEARARWNLERSSYSSPDPLVHIPIDIQGRWEAAIEEAEKAEEQQLRREEAMSQSDASGGTLKKTTSYSLFPSTSSRHLDAGRMHAQQVLEAAKQAQAAVQERPRAASTSSLSTTSIATTPSNSAAKPSCMGLTGRSASSRYGFRRSPTTSAWLANTISRSSLGSSG